MFRITDIRNIAIQIEKNGESSYRQAAEQVTNPKIKKIFLWLANEERRHMEWFERLQSETEIPQEHAEMEQMGKSLLQDMISNQTFSLDQDQLNQTSTFTEVLAQSKAFEEDTILFYQFLRGLIEDEATARELDTIIEEERLHAIRLTQLVETSV